MRAAVIFFLIFSTAYAALPPISNLHRIPKTLPAKASANTPPAPPTPATPPGVSVTTASPAPTGLSLKKRLQARMQKAPASGSAFLIFDLPVTYNRRVSFWISHFQDKGKAWFRDWLERSTKYMPFIQKELKNAGLPQDLAF